MRISMHRHALRSSIRSYADLPATLHWLCLGTLVNRAGSFLIPFLTIYVRDELQLSISVATQAVGALGVGSIIASVLGGHLTDRLGRRAVMLISLVGSGGVMLAIGSLRSPAGIIGAAFLFTLLADMYRPASLAMLADVVEPARRPQAFGLLYVSINLGFTIGAIVGGVVARHSFQWLFWGDAVTSSAFALLLVFVVRETLPGRASGSTSGSVTAQHGPSMLQAACLIISDRVFMLFSLATFLAGSVFLQFMSALPLEMLARGLETDDYGAVIAINGMMIVVFQLPVTAVVSGGRRNLLIALSALLTGVGFGAVPLVAGSFGFAAIIVVVTVGEMVQAPLTQAVVGDLAPAHMRGRYMGVLSLCFALALSIGGPLGGWVLESAGSEVLWTGCLVVASIAAAIYLGLGRHIGAPLKKEGATHPHG